jgi:hypothetical protein
MFCISAPAQALDTATADRSCLRTALVKPAMNSAANTHASTRKTQPARVSQAAVVDRLSLTLYKFFYQRLDQGG